MTRRPALVSLFAVTVLAACAVLVGASPASADSTREARLLVKINNARVEQGLRPVTPSPDLEAAAEDHTRSMAGARTLFHTASFSRLCCWSMIGENVGYGYTVRGLHRQLMHSAPHRANILSPRVRQVGIAIVSRGGGLWVTEVFRDPR